MKYPNFAGEFSKALNKAGYITKAETVVLPKKRKRKSPDLIMMMKDGTVVTVKIEIERKKI